jgi:hypothetical protein
MGRTKRTVSLVYEVLREGAKEAGSTSVSKRQIQCYKILTFKGRGTECVRNIKYLGTAISNTDDGTEEVRVGIVAANKAYSSLQTVSRSKQIH